MANESYLLLEDPGESNLEKYLSDVYDNEIKEGSDRSDIDFIQSGVENIVKHGTDEILKKLRTEINDEIETFKRHFPKLKYLDKTFAGKFDNIVKVGGFYKENVTGPINDFYFMIIIGVFQCDSDIYSCYKYPTIGQKSITKSMKNVLHRIAVHHHDTRDERRSQQFQYMDSGTKQCIGLHNVDMEDRGRCRLSLTYTRRVNNKRVLKYINVTLTTAFRVYLGENADWLCPNSFISGISNKLTPKELLKPEKVLIFQGKVSIVEIEHHFMSQVVSQRHQKVYTLLKHILKLNEHLKPDAWTDDRKRESRIYHVTLFDLKRCVVFHNHLCENKISSGLGTCVLDILSDIYDGDYLPEDEHPSMRKRKSRRLRKLLVILKSSEQSSDVYSYEDLTNLVLSIKKPRNVVKRLRLVQHDHNDCLQRVKFVLLVLKYLFVIIVGAIICYFLFHSVVTPR